MNEEVRRSYPRVSISDRESNPDGVLLALDIGTTTTRALLFDLAGHPVAEAYREVDVAHPRPNWAEIDAQMCWRATLEVLEEIFDPGPYAPEDVLAVGLSGLLHALIPVDEAGNPLARAMLWMDQRCQPQADWLSREHEDLVCALTGRRSVSTTYSAPKLRWLVEHDPDLVDQTSKFLPMKDFIRLQLTGTVATDPSDAGGTMLYDRARADWSEALLEAIGVPLEKLPPIRPSTEVAGGITFAAAAMTGLIKGTPVVVGGGDTLCTRIGTHAEGTDRACLYLGTAAWMSVPQRRAGCFSATATTGATLRWLVDLFDPAPGATPALAYKTLLKKAASVDRGAQGLLFLPHLMGERGPKNNPQAKGVLFGLSLAHKQPEITRAVLEGCALHIRSILEHLTEEPLREIAVVGGGAKSALWRGIIADVNGVTVMVPAVLEAGALGAAILAGVGIGVYDDVRSASCRLVRVAERREPDPSDKRFYDEVFSVYMDLEQRVTDLYGRVPVE
jgi:xylulokinase